MSATELPGFGAGTYAWTTASAKIRLTNANTSTVTVEGLANASASRDAETITVTRTGPGCSPIVKTVTVTVAKVTFSAAATQRYGYDDFDTPANHTDDHVCVKSADHTFVHVVIDGGAVGTDFNWVCEPAGICTPVAPGGAASFDLRLNADPNDHANTTLHARVRCPSNASFAHLEVHVYKEVLVEVVVAKIQDSRVAGTALHRPRMDAAAHTATVNAKLKEAVVKFDITNYSATNAITNVAYDIDRNGALSFDINANGGAEVTAINAAMTGTGTKTRIAVVKALKSYYYLSAAAAIGDTDLTIRGGNVFDYAPFFNVALGLGANQENVTVSRTSGATITLSSGVTKAHAIGTPIEFVASGWSSDPIIITEENASNGSLITENAILWTIPHEVGHRALSLADVNDATNFMHFQQSWTDYRLRYCPRNRYYNPPGGTENQWETIPR